VREVLYYPGCSMDGTALGYARSVEQIAPILDLHLNELEDWNCCGASEYLSIGPLRGFALIARNLALAERQGHSSPTLVAPCSQCFVNLAKTNAYVRADGHLAGRINDALSAGGLAYTPGSVRVRHLFEIVARDVGVDAVRAKVRRPLRGLRVAPYLGCLVTRPDVDDRWLAKEQPRAFDVLIEALGADVVDYPLRTECCGGHLSQVSPDTGLTMIRRLIDSAERLGADLMVTVCPMCQMNVDFYQGEVNARFHTSHRMPILFFTQLMGLAFGLPASTLGIGSETVGAGAALAKIGIAVAPPEGADMAAAARPRASSRRGPELPMPRMRDDGHDGEGGR
jgi:heterodisulfide reductase subunit B2